MQRNQRTTEKEGDIFNEDQAGLGKRRQNRCESKITQMFLAWEAEMVVTVHGRGRAGPLPGPGVINAPPLPLLPAAGGLTSQRRSTAQTGATDA